MAIINLTPHDVTLLDEDNKVVEVFPASGEVLRLGTVDLGSQVIVGVGRVDLVEFGHLNNPPKPKINTWYIVSLPCALSRPRSDFLVPYMEVRDDQGRIIGCKSLARPV